MKQDAVRQLVFSWQERVMTRQGVERQIEPHILACFGSRPIKIITGFRRSGKSFLTQQIARKLVTSGAVHRENVLYLNFEDYRLQECVNPDDLDQIFTLFMQTAVPGRRLVIFDEIQNVPGWDRFVRTLYEREDDLELLLTGSNSELLSAELGSNLAGRFIEFFLFPFSFSEFLLYRHQLPHNMRAFERQLPAITKHFHEYLVYGGLPEVFDIPRGEAKLSYLSGVLTKVVLDDVVKRFRVEHVGLLEKLLNYLLATVGNVTSYAALVKKSASLGFSVKNSTIVEYVSYLQKSFALLEVSKFSWKQSRHFATTKKYYAVDTGLASIVRPIEENHAFRLENLILLELKRRSSEIFYGSSDSGRELDFLARTTDRWEQYQVTDTLTDGNRRRELGSFSLAAPYLSGGRTLLTLDDADDVINYEGLRINRKGIIRWFVERQPS